MADTSEILSLQQQIATAQAQLAVLQDAQANKTTYNKAANQLEAVQNPNNAFSQPTTSYAPKYPYNNAKATESGHLMEFDDTPGAERVSIAHRTGTFFEIGPDGSKTEKIFNDNYQIVMKDDYIHIMGKATVSVQGDIKVYVQGNAQLQVDGDVNWQVGGNMNMAIDGMFTASAADFNFVGPINQVGDFLSSGNIVNQGNISSAKNIQAQLNFLGHQDMVLDRDAYIGRDEFINRNISSGTGGKATMTVNGSASFTGDVIANGISLDNHVHSGVQPGSGTTGKPQ